MKLKSALYILLVMFANSLFVQLPSLNLPKHLDNLVEGNKRFISNKINEKDFENERSALVQGQSPYVIVVACSDSRVAPEYIFDEELGKIFVIRTAGNVLDKIELGSIEYAAEHLHSPLLLILGHTSCGAVKAAMEPEDVHSINLESIINKIEPAVKKAKSTHKDKEDAYDAAIKQNVLEQIIFAEKNSKIIKELVEEHKLTIIGGIYDIKSGEVEFIDE